MIVSLTIPLIWGAQAVIMYRTPAQVHFQNIHRSAAIIGISILLGGLPSQLFTARNASEAFIMLVRVFALDILATYSGYGVHNINRTMRIQLSKRHHSAAPALSLEGAQWNLVVEEGNTDNDNDVAYNNNNNDSDVDDYGEDRDVIDSQRRRLNECGGFLGYLKAFMVFAPCLLRVLGPHQLGLTVDKFVLGSIAQIDTDQCGVPIAFVMARTVETPAQFILQSSPWFVAYANNNLLTAELIVRDRGVGNCVGNYVSNAGPN